MILAKSNDTKGSNRNGVCVCGGGVVRGVCVCVHTLKIPERALSISTGNIYIGAYKSVESVYF